MLQHTLHNPSIGEIRQAIRTNRYSGHTSGYCSDLAQFNIVILAADKADDFNTFCAANAQACPVVFRSKPGQTRLTELGNIDIRTDIPAYNVFQFGKLQQEQNNIVDLWQDDWVVFAIGCSFTFETALIEARIKLAHIDQKKNVAMFDTNVPLVSAGPFHGTMVVSMRWIDSQQVDRAVEVTARYPKFHGAPVHIGSPESIGITAIEKPDYGDAAQAPEGTVPVFWACGVSTQQAIINARLPVVITHKPGCMLISDRSHASILTN